LAAILAAIGLSFAVAPDIRGALGAALAILAAIIAIVDWRSYTIPDAANAAAAALGLAWQAIEGGDAAAAIAAALARALAMGALFLAFQYVYRRLRGREGMGLGDVKLAAVAGLWLDASDLPIAVDIACFSALGFVLLSRLRAGPAPQAATKLPFGAFFAPSIWLCWLFAQWRA
jgi:leader peptidase (prepilin peptidase)/N-methyltransferase